jgi:hypothetical protein
VNRKNNSLFEKFSETTTPPHQPGDNVGGLILVLRGVKEYGNIAIQVNFQILADGLQVSIIDLSYVKSALSQCVRIDDTEAIAADLLPIIVGIVYLVLTELIFGSCDSHFIPSAGRDYQQTNDERQAYENAPASAFPVACCGVSERTTIRWFKYLTFRRFPVPL